MEGPVLSGGVIVLVAVALWMLYLLPSWRGRHQYYAAERNAVRMNQALRVLAETSETPEEVRVELSTRSALAQQKLAKRAAASREAAELVALRAELAAAKANPVLRQARARRRVRVSASLILLAGLGAAGYGGWQAWNGGAQALLWSGVAAAVLATILLHRMAQVARRAARREAVVSEVAPAAPRVAPPLHDQGSATWTPRKLPEPLTSVAGSQAQRAQASAEAQRERQAAAAAAEIGRRAEQMAPPAPTPLPAASEFTRMGYVDDAEIEAHVRRLLEQRAAG